MAPQSGSKSYTAPHPGAAQLPEVYARLGLALDRANAFGGTHVDPRVLLELRGVVDEALQLASVTPGCRYGCEGSGFRCPIADPPERMAARLQAEGWVADWDSVEARAAQDTMCLCGSKMSYAALRPGDGELGEAWAVCGACRHWVRL